MAPSAGAGTTSVLPSPGVTATGGAVTTVPASSGRAVGPAEPVGEGDGAVVAEPAEADAGGAATPSSPKKETAPQTSPKKSPKKKAGGKSK